MGCITTSKTVKKLGQFLEEKQEPFILEIYLSERGCLKNNKKLNSDSSKIKSTTHGSQEISEADRFSSASCITDFSSCSESHVHMQKDDICQYTENEDASIRKMGWNCTEESEQISPESVLQVESRSSFTPAKKITEDSLISPSLWNLIFHSAKDKQCCVGTATELEELPNSQFYKSKKILQQTKQLLFDCVRVVLKERRHQNYKESMGAELLGKLMSEQIETWRKQSRDQLNIRRRLLDFYFQDSVQEWTYFEPQMMRDLAWEIGDAILEDIRDQIVTDMVSM